MTQNSLLDRPATTDTRMLARQVVTKGDSQDILRLLSDIGTPFSPEDVTAGCENEFQAAVVGPADKVDLPRRIEDSAFYRNLLRRVGAGDVPPRRLLDLQDLLRNNSENIWENSWVTLPRDAVNAYALAVFSKDLTAHKKLGGAMRGDADKFVLKDPAGHVKFRIPVSGLLKLALAQAIGASRQLPPDVREIAEKAMDHFLNDNTSPEVYSFSPVKSNSRDGVGGALARETLRRFLLSHSLLEYANREFALAESQQKAIIYFSPLTPHRQRRLNDLISDEFYRELFMNPCLSGWDQGEAKYQYMILCHQVLSRSRLHTLAKLREAGINSSRLVVLPSISNTSLANNGTHVSLGSRVLTQLLQANDPRFTAVVEKRLGDLVIKIVEHFLPLFVDTFTAAPYRLDFAEFHPEIALGFLPHELDFTHLRMAWRRWKKKAAIRRFGMRWTPTGWHGFDNFMARVLRLRGDIVPDYRLLDYLVCPISTDESPALNGEIGNDLKLRRDLAEQGIFDEKMAHYTLYRLRDFARRGFSGFEGRFYSQFPSLQKHMAAAVNLQTVVTAMAYRMAIRGEVTHADIPDTPDVESERRQIVFDSAIGLPTFYVRSDTKNTFLKRILERTGGCRISRRYPKYTRVMLKEYRHALIRFVQHQARDLIESMNMAVTLADLEQMVMAPEEQGAAAVLVRQATGLSLRSALRLSADEMSLEMERYYRDELQRQYLNEACEVLAQDARKLDRIAGEDPSVSSVLHEITRGQTLTTCLGRWQRMILAGQGTSTEWLQLMHVLFLAIRESMKETLS